MKSIKFLLAASLVTLTSLSFAQDSETRKFIDNADYTQVNKNWSVTADFESGIGEIVSFFPVEAIDLKSGQKLKSLQMDMTIKTDLLGTGKNQTYFKSSWIDIAEVDEFIVFIEKYVIPNLKDKTEKNTSTNYIFNSKEITFHFYIEKGNRRISIYLKDGGVVDRQRYFWTESQVKKIPELLEVLKKIK